MMQCTEQFSLDYASILQKVSLVEFAKIAYWIYEKEDFLNHQHAFQASWKRLETFVGSNGLKIGFYAKQQGAQTLVVAAIRGTANIDNAWTDIQLLQGAEPTMLEQARSCIKERFAALANEVGEGSCLFCLTGHSLGALLAEIIALQLNPCVFAITFESPGSYPWLKHIDSAIRKHFIHSHLVGCIQGRKGVKKLPKGKSFVSTAFKQSGNIYELCACMPSEKDSWMEAYLQGEKIDSMLLLKTLWDPSIKPDDVPTWLHSIVLQVPELIPVLRDIWASHRMENIIRGLESEADFRPRLVETWECLAYDEMLALFLKRVGLDNLSELFDAVSDMPDELLRRSGMASMFDRYQDMLKKPPTTSLKKIFDELIESK